VLILKDIWIAIQFVYFTFTAKKLPFQDAVNLAVEKTLEKKFTYALAIISNSVGCTEHKAPSINIENLKYILYLNQKGTLDDQATKAILKDVWTQMFQGFKYGKYNTEFEVFVSEKLQLAIKF
jgi:hypothetical protein